MRDTKYVKCRCGWIFFLVPKASFEESKCTRCGHPASQMKSVTSHDVPRGATIVGLRDPAEEWNAEIIQFPVQ